MFHLRVNSNCIEDNNGVMAMESVHFTQLPEFARKHAGTVKCDDACVGIEFNHNGVLWLLEDADKVAA